MCIFIREEKFWEQEEKVKEKNIERKKLLWS
jgi:hypothetical protein